MRFGIYLGRHGGAGGGMGLYSQEFVRELVGFLESPEFREDEAVLYGDSSIFTKDLLDDLSLSPVLSVVTESSVFGRPAGSFFKPLPNGAKVRLVVRLLPEWTGRRAGYLFDQLFVGLLSRLDRLRLLHCTMNFGILPFGGTQMVTVHDLFQAYPPASSGSKDTAQAPGLGKRIVRALYRTLFRLQFRTVTHVISDSKTVAEEISMRFSIDPASISVVPLGLDRTFMNFLEAQHRADEWLSEEALVWARGKGLAKGYFLVLGSLDPRKNLERTLLAWRTVQSGLPDADLVIVSSSRQVRATCEKILNELPTTVGANAAGWTSAPPPRAQTTSPDAGPVRKAIYLDPLPRDEMPLLFSNAGVVILPTLAEGFGLPALEARAVGSAVVSGPLEHLSGSSERVFLCDPWSTESIAQAIKSAGESPGQPPPAAGRKSGRISEKQWERIAAQWPTMRAAVKQTLAHYRQAVLRTPPGRTRVGR